MTVHITNPTFIAGFNDFHEGLPVEANPFLFEANPWRLYNYGWCTAMLIHLANQDVYTLPEDIVGTEAGLRRIDKSPFAQGQVAYRKSIALSDCPYGPGSTDYDDWRAGWEWEQEHRPQIQRIASDPPLERLAFLAWLLKRHSWGLIAAAASVALSALLIALLAWRFIL